MTKKDWINITLFILLASMTIFASQGGFNSAGLWSRAAFSIGISMLGGIVCGTTLYGIEMLKLEKVHDQGHFLRINRNQDMGERYWIQFIKDLGKDSRPVWFVGNRHGTWINRGFAYRRHVREKIIERVNHFLQNESRTGWEIFIIVTEEDAAEQWKAFINEEIQAVTNYSQTRPDLIKIGLVDESKVRYSIVAYANGVVITPYTSRGRSAESPTFQVLPDSDVATLYFNDLERIKGEVTNWLV